MNERSLFYFSLTISKERIVDNIGQCITGDAIVPLNWIFNCLTCSLIFSQHNVQIKANTSNNCSLSQIFSKYHPSHNSFSK